MVIGAANRITRAGACGRVIARTAMIAAISATIDMTAASRAKGRFGGCVIVLAAWLPLAGVVAIHFNSSATSCALCQRSSRSFARHFAITWSRAAGDTRTISLTGFGIEPTMDAIRLVFVLPSNARCPVVISYSSAPNAKMSLRASASSPSSCSGAMYWNVPRIVPSVVSGFCIVAPSTTTSIAALFARPKSSSFAPDLVIITFAGFKSRCTTPARCARCSASAICAP